MALRALLAGRPAREAMTLLVRGLIALLLGMALTLLGWLDQDASLSLYDDDGLSTDVDLERGLTEIRVTVREGRAMAEGGSLTLDATRLLMGEVRA